MNAPIKHRDEYRDSAEAQRYADVIARTATRPWTLMEVCGGQTHAIVRFGIDRLLPDTVSLVHGPGCPVCVTPTEYIDGAIAMAAVPDVVLCSFGDMLRVPGTNSSLQQAKSRGADVRAVYSPLDAVQLAQELPNRRIVFLAVGFETTAPANAMAVYRANELGLKNFFMLVSHVLVPPAIRTLLAAPDNQVQAFLAAGHVCAIMGYHQYEPIAARYRVPIVVTGFEPLDILQGILMCVRQLEAGEARVENQYKRAVQRAGNRAALRIIESVFQLGPRRWRGIGEIPASGWSLRDSYRRYDAEHEFGSVSTHAVDHSDCISGRILRGQVKPVQCAAFGTRCTPEHPLGVTMVSAEGACAAYYRYRHIASDIDATKSLAETSAETSAGTSVEAPIEALAETGSNT